MRTTQTEPRPTTAKLKIPPRVVVVKQPEFIRLPKAGELCPFSGLARSALNALILPTEENGFKPPVKSYCLRQKGARTGIRIISWASLRAHILAHEDVPPNCNASSADAA